MGPIVADILRFLDSLSVSAEKITVIVILGAILALHYCAAFEISFGWRPSIRARARRAAGHSLKDDLHIIACMAAYTAMAIAVLKLV